MKTVLCYGNSLTWGYNAEDMSRHPIEDRWPTVLQAALGSEVTVIAEGLNGRTTAFDDHMADCDRNGARLLPTVLATHMPLDLVIIMLGANDMKPFISGYAFGSKQGVERLVEIVRHHANAFAAEPPQVLIVAPPPLSETADPDFAAMFAGGISESRKLASLYRQVADWYGCGFFDAGTVAETTPLDGVHLDAENTRAIGAALAPLAAKMLGL